MRWDSVIPTPVEGRSPSYLSLGMGVRAERFYSHLQHHCPWSLDLAALLAQLKMQLSSFCSRASTQTPCSPFKSSLKGWLRKHTHICIKCFRNNRKILKYINKEVIPFICNLKVKQTVILSLKKIFDMNGGILCSTKVNLKN